MPRCTGPESLFERLIIQPRVQQDPCRQQLADQHVAAIKRHLQRLLNTRRGCSLSSPGLGLADFNGHSGAAVLMNRIGADIRVTVETYEPRLRVLHVHHQPDAAQPLALNFRLDCQLRTGPRDASLQIDLVIVHQHTYVK